MGVCDAQVGQRGVARCISLRTWRQGKMLSLALKRSQDGVDETRGARFLGLTREIHGVVHDR